MIHYNFKFSIFTFCLFLVACDAQRENDPVEITVQNLSLVLEKNVNKTILPALEATRNKAADLKQQAEVFCSLPEETSLDLLQERWKDLSAQWYQLSIYNFGPLNDDVVFPQYMFIDSLRLRGTDYTQTVRENISNLLVNDTPLIKEYFDSFTFQKVGLLPLELLIFETATGEHSTISSDIVNDFSNNSRKCEMTIQFIKQIESRLEYVSNGWLVGYLDTSEPYRDLFLQNRLEDGSEPITTLLVSVQSHLDYLQKRHIVSTAAQVSDHAWQNISASIDQVELLLQGHLVNSEDSHAETNASFFALMENAGFENSVILIKENIAQIRASIENRDAASLEVDLGDLDGNFKREIPQALAVTLGINFTDGD